RNPTTITANQKHANSTSSVNTNPSRTSRLNISPASPCPGVQSISLPLTANAIHPHPRAATQYHHRDHTPKIRPAPSRSRLAPTTTATGNNSPVTTNLSEKYIQPCSSTKCSYA